MLNQPIEAQLSSASDMVDHSAQWAKSIPSRIGRFFTAAHYALTLAGIAALFVLGMMFFNPDFADKLMALSPFSDEQPEEVVPEAPSLANLMDVPAPALTAAAPVAAAAAVPMTDEERKIIGTPRQQKLVTNWLSKRYRVAGDATDMLVSAAYLTAREIKLDPLLILAVMAIESRFNPFAESPMGAQGLMQVMSKVHHDKFQELGGVKAALNPVANIKVGSLILKEYVTRGGSVEAGLKSYVGAADMENDGGYGLKVLSEYQNLKEVAVGKNISIFTTALIKAPAPIVRPALPATPAKPTAVGDMAAAAPKKPGVTASEEIAAL
ncbi:transglycosylase SLT domain-containing protein [Herbaspirillum rhizosphaerae]|uniref:transglycosylase SLT domain-containing protein n=1 Tax=Herbaspirillum rhizosphaerae TaxID=346179 RepID=UPI00067B1054|nr:lytic transglycosylase domain-containing protein [Herbaspirillum rhizosphaerae]